MAELYSELTTPNVVVDLDIVDRNLCQMADALKRNGLNHRPHMKTHKSVAMGRRQLESGAYGITVAKLSEAEIFAEAGFDDILIAYSIIGDDKLARFENLHKRVQLTVTVDSMESANGLSLVGVDSRKKVRVLIEVDGGLHRGGRQPGQDTVDFARELLKLPGIELVGVMGYFGQIYKEVSVEAIESAAKRESSLLAETVQMLKDGGICIEIVSAGSSPSSKMAEHLSAITEVRAGNYIFNDATAVALGLAEENDCALRVIATVISTPVPGRATIDAGSKTLTSDLAPKRDGYGILVNHPGALLFALNEEHGMIQFDSETTEFHLGDRVEIIPNHSCVLPNLNDTIYGVRQNKLVETIRIDARGCNY